MWLSLSRKTKKEYYKNTADDNTPYVARENLEEVIESLEQVSESIFKWFSDNQMKANAEKCHLLTSGKKEMSLKIGDTNIGNSDSEKLLSIKIDRKLTFGAHLKDMCKG